MQLQSARDFCEKLRKTQKDSAHPNRFELELTKALQQLFGENNVRHLGGADAPDILVKVEGRKVVVNAKATARKSLGEAYIRWDADDKHKRKHGAERVAYVAASFSAGNMREFAERHGAKLIETEAICKALTNHLINPYEGEWLFETLFGGGRPTIVSPSAVEPSTKSFERQLWIAKEIIGGLKRKSKVSLKEVYHYLHFRDDTVTEQEVRDAFNLLTEPVHVLRAEEQETYSLASDTDSLRRKVWMLSQALGIEPTAPSAGTEATTEFAPEVSEVTPDSKALKQILEVCRLMKQGIGYPEACRKVATKLEVTPSTVADKCTRRLGLNAEGFQEMFGTGQLVSLLIKKFPEHDRLIRSMLS